jgi:hypothetical protein
MIFSTSLKLWTEHNRTQMMRVHLTTPMVCGKNNLLLHLTLDQFVNRFQVMTMTMGLMSK